MDLIVLSKFKETHSDVSAFTGLMEQAFCLESFTGDYISCNDIDRELSKFDEVAETWNEQMKALMDNEKETKWVAVYYVYIDFLCKLTEVPDGIPASIYTMSLESVKAQTRSLVANV